MSMFMYPCCSVEKFVQCSFVQDTVYAALNPVLDMGSLHLLVHL